MSTLNNRSELISNCRHSKKFLLKNVFAQQPIIFLHVTPLRIVLYFQILYIFICIRYFWQLPDDCSARSMKLRVAINVFEQIIQLCQSIYIYIYIYILTEWSCAIRLPWNIGSKVEFQNPLSEDGYELKRKYELSPCDFCIACNFMQFHFLLLHGSV